MKLPGLALLAVLSTTVVPVLAQDAHPDGISIIQPYVRATPPGATTGAGYIIFDAGQVDDRLVGIETDAAERVELHQNQIVDGVARMRPMADGLFLPANAETILGEDGTHAMFFGLAAPFIVGQEIEATLIFEKAGRVPIVFTAEPMSGPSEKHLHEGQ